MGTIEQEEATPLLASSDHQPHGLHYLQSQSHSQTAHLITRSWLELQKIWQLAAPSIFSRVAMFSITVITQAFAGRLEDLDLAATSIATTVIISVTFSILLGMATALETLCGQAYGANQYHMLGIYLQRSWIVLSICSIILLPLFIYSTPILKLIGQSTDVADRTGLVALWLIPMHLTFPFQFSLQKFLQSQLKTAVIAWVSGLALGIHVLVTWVFVYRLEVGIVGAALTIGFSWWVSVLGLFAYTVLGGCPLSWTGFSAQAFAGLWDFFKLSTASGVMLLYVLILLSRFSQSNNKPYAPAYYLGLENLYFRVLIIVVGFLQATETATDALSVCVTIYGWDSMISLGFLAATGVRVANELGAGNAKGAKFATAGAGVTAFLVGFILFSIIIAFPNKITSIFTSSAPVIEMVDELSLLLAFTILLNCIQPVLTGVAVGFRWQALVAYVNLGSCYVVGLPFGILLGWLQFGITGVWAGMIAGTALQTLLLIVITLKFDWEAGAKRAVIIQFTEPLSQ